MNWPLITRGSHQRALAAEQAETLRVKKVKDEWWQRHDAVAEELAAVSIVNTGLTEDLAAVREELAVRTRPNSVPLAEFEAEKRRADRLQARLDDALGLNATAVTAGSTWQDRRETRMRYDKTPEESTS